jgi:hypothetical protein
MSRFPDTIQAKLPPGVASQVEAVASAQHTTTSQYVRTAVMDRLKTDAGSLYNVTAAGVPFALVDGDRIVTISYHADGKPHDGRTWLPVVYEDSEPFDIERHWRLAPIDSIRGDKVVRQYPVVLKSGEDV